MKTKEKVNCKYKIYDNFDSNEEAQIKIFGIEKGSMFQVLWIKLMDIINNNIEYLKT